MASDTAKTTRTASTRVREISRLETLTRHAFATLAVAAVVIALLLGGSVYLLAEITGFAFWPWPLASAALPAGLFVSVLVTAVYLGISVSRQSAARIRLFQRQQQSLSRSQENYERLMELSMGSRTLPSKRDLDSLCTRITQIAYDTFKCDRASLLILDQDNKELEVRAALGRGDMDLVLGARQEVGDAIAGWVAEHRRPLLLGPQINVKKFWRFKPKLQPILSSMAVPLLFRDQLYGVICVCFESDDKNFTQEDLRALQVLAFNGAVTMKNLFDASGSRDSGSSETRPRRRRRKSA